MPSRSGPPAPVPSTHIGDIMNDLARVGELPAAATLTVPPLTTMVSLPSSKPPIPICNCVGGGTVYEKPERAEAEGLIIIDRYTIGSRTLALVPCCCAEGAEVARRWRNLPREAEGVTLETLRAIPDPGWPAAAAAVKAFIAQPRGWLTLAGNYGTGKTRLAYAALNGLAARGVYGRYLLLPDLMDELRNAIKTDTYAERLQRVIQAPVLVLDELDKFRDDSEWIAEVIEGLFLRRYRESRYTGTILVYNLERGARLPGFLLSRMRDSHFQYFALTGRDLRPLAEQLDPWDRGTGEL